MFPSLSKQPIMRPPPKENPGSDPDSCYHATTQHVTLCNDIFKNLSDIFNCWLWINNWIDNAKSTNGVIFSTWFLIWSIFSRPKFNNSCGGRDKKKEKKIFFFAISYTKGLEWYLKENYAHSQKFFKMDEYTVFA